MDISHYIGHSGYAEMSKLNTEEMLNVYKTLNREARRRIKSATPGMRELPIFKQILKSDALIAPTQKRNAGNYRNILYKRSRDIISFLQAQTSTRSGYAMYINQMNAALMTAGAIRTYTAPEIVTIGHIFDLVRKKAAAFLYDSEQLARIANRVYTEQAQLPDELDDTEIAPGIFRKITPDFEERLNKLIEEAIQDEYEKDAAARTGQRGIPYFG